MAVEAAQPGRLAGQWLPLLVVVAVGLGFGLLVLLVRLHLEPVMSVDRGVVRRLNEVVSPRSYLVNALNGTPGWAGIRSCSGWSASPRRCCWCAGGFTSRSTC